MSLMAEQISGNSATVVGQTECASYRAHSVRSFTWRLLWRR